MLDEILKIQSRSGLAIPFGGGAEGRVVILWIILPETGDECCLKCLGFNAYLHLCSQGNCHEISY